MELLGVKLGIGGANESAPRGHMNTCAHSSRFSDSASTGRSGWYVTPRRVWGRKSGAPDYTSNFLQLPTVGQSAQHVLGHENTWLATLSSVILVTLIVL